LHPIFIKKMQKCKYIFIPLMLLVMFVAYQASITMFSHIHYVYGVMIVHSHPSSDNQHTHTDGQILTLAHVSHWAGVEPACITLGEVSLSVFDTLECKRDFRILSDKREHSISLRAPPFC